MAVKRPCNRETVLTKFCGVIVQCNWCVRKMTPSVIEVGAKIAGCDQN